MLLTGYLITFMKLSITADISVNNNNLIHKYKLSKKDFWYYITHNILHNFDSVNCNSPYSCTYLISVYSYGNF